MRPGLRWRAETLPRWQGLAVTRAHNRAMIDFCTQNLLEAGKTGVEFYPESRPREAEVSGTERALHLSKLAYWASLKE